MRRLWQGYRAMPPKPAIAQRAFQMGTTPNLVRPFIQANTVDGGTVQQDGQIVGLNDGGYVIIYNDQSPTFTSGQAIVGQRFDAAGNKVGGELRVGAFDDGQDSVAGGSSITKLPNGNIAFAYTDVFNGHSDVWVRVLTPALGVVRDDADRKSTRLNS